MSAESFAGPAYQAHTGPDHSAALMTLLIRFARKVALRDAIKVEIEVHPEIGDLVVEMSSFRPIPDPHSIGWLRGFDTDDTDGQIFWIEPLFAASGTPWQSWGNASFLTIDRKYWKDLGIAAGGVVPQ